MKTKQEQIEELRSKIYYARSKVNGIATSNDIAETLYSIGYRKVPDGAVVLTPEERDDLIAKVGVLGRENYDLKAENKQLKTECALLDDELRIARQDTINVLNKVKDYVNQLACDEYGDSACDTNYVTIDIDKYEQDIDELIKEVLNAENKG